MIYEQALAKLRKELDVSVEPAPTPSIQNRGLIPQRAPAQTSGVADDPLSFAKDWMRAIKQSGEQARSRFQREAETVLQRESTVVSRPARKQPIEKDVSEETTSPSERESMFSGREEVESEGRGSFSLPSGEGMTSLVRLMDRHEGAGNYSTLFGHSQNNRFAGIDVSKMTLGEVKEFTNPRGVYGSWVRDKIGRVSTPVGRYQFVGTTLRQVQREMGLDDDTVFNGRTQDAMFHHYLNKRLSQGKTISEKVDQLRQAWEGFKAVPTTQLAAIVRNLENAS